jgi:hypothetical protein
MTLPFWHTVHTLQTLKAFFVEERGLEHALVTTLPRDTCYVVVQCIEFGGDHLDLLMGKEYGVLPSLSANTP